MLLESISMSNKYREEVIAETKYVYSTLIDL